MQNKKNNKKEKKKKKNQQQRQHKNKRKRIHAKPTEGMQSRKCSHRAFTFGQRVARGLHNCKGQRED